MIEKFGYKATRIKTIISSLLVAVAIIATPLLTFSESAVKGIIDRWLSQCVVIYDKKKDNTDSILVRMFTYGSMPKSLRVVMRTTNSTNIREVMFMNHVEQSVTQRNESLLVHPLANQTCPGMLCKEILQQQNQGRLSLRISPATSNYTYLFRVKTDAIILPEELMIYTQPEGDDVFACRVESPGLTNYFSRQTVGVQILLLSSLFIAITLLLGISKEMRHGDEK